MQSPRDHAAYAQKINLQDELSRLKKINSVWKQENPSGVAENQNISEMMMMNGMTTQPIESSPIFNTQNQEAQCNSSNQNQQTQGENHISNFLREMDYLKIPEEGMDTSPTSPKGLLNDEVMDDSISWLQSVEDFFTIPTPTALLMKRYNQEIS